ncbi:MAG: hypothetical protein JNM68_05275 [Dinghuibacter sp.]|nr:hypothetical protein [Dinghuibacter sp.]
MKKNIKKLTLKKNTVLLLSEQDKLNLQTGNRVQASGEDCPFTRQGSICNLTRYPCTVTLL